MAGDDSVRQVLTFCRPSVSFCCDPGPVDVAFRQQCDDDQAEDGDSDDHAVALAVRAFVFLAGTTGWTTSRTESALISDSPRSEAPSERTVSWSS